MVKKYSIFELLTYYFRPIKFERQLVDTTARILPAEPLFFSDNKPTTSPNADWSNFTKDKKFSGPAQAKKYIFVYPKREHEIAMKFLAKLKEVIYYTCSCTDIHI